MCYNIAFLTKRLEMYAARYKDSLPPGWQASAGIADQPLPEYYFVSGFEYPQLPVVTGSDILNCTWGLIPYWTKDPVTASEIRTKTHNAVGETVFEKPSFRKSIATRRCLLGINGFYEWRLFNKTKYPHLITIEGSEVFSLGCLYDSWTDQTTGEVRHTFSIITTPANPLMETIHNTKKRMPLIIPPDREKEWVSPALTTAEINGLIKTYEGNDLRATTISMTANNVRNNRNMPNIMHPVPYPELSLF
jgi:putative SOS response-associated peptidase YedK